MTLTFQQQVTALETWRPVVGFEGYYEVSSLGRVRSLDRIVGGTGCGVRQQRGHMLKEACNKYGYCIVSLHKLGKGKTYRVHRLVAAAYIPNPLNKPSVNHKDLCKQNNFVDNLEWCTAKENTQHAVRHGVMGGSNRHTEAVLRYQASRRSRSVFNGYSKTAEEWAVVANLKLATFYYRRGKGWDMERTLTTPLRPKRYSLVPMSAELRDILATKSEQTEE